MTAKKKTKLNARFLIGLESKKTGQIIPYMTLMKKYGIDGQVALNYKNKGLPANISAFLEMLIKVGAVDKNLVIKE